MPICEKTAANATAQILRSFPRRIMKKYRIDATNCKWNRMTHSCIPTQYLKIVVNDLHLVK